MGVCGAGRIGPGVSWESGRVVGGSGRASPVSTGDEVAFGMGVGGAAGDWWVSVVVDEEGSRRGPSLRSE